MQHFSVSPREMIASLWNNRELTAALIKRDVVGRYRGSALGILWSFFNPTFMLAVYTFVFSVIFKARWNSASESKTEFALILFAGLIIFNFFSECFTRAPNLILTNPNYVKKVVFPLEILPWVSIGSAFFHFLISLIVWLIFYTASFGAPPITATALPIVLLPLIFMTAGICWFLSAVGVYLRDASQFIGIISTVLMFLSPIFYPISSLPKDYQPLLFINPLTLIIEQARDVLIWNKLPDWHLFLAHMAAAIAIFWLGFAWFQKTRKGFADVI